jgi:hypothetical protein
MLKHKAIRSLEQTNLTGDVGELLVAWSGHRGKGKIFSKFKEVLVAEFGYMLLYDIPAACSSM